MKSIGLVLVELATQGPLEVKRLVRAGMQLVPRGRMLAVTYALPSSWGKTIPYESIALQSVMGEPAIRSEADEWKFFSTIAVRFCSTTSPHERVVVQEQAILLLCRDGDKAYRRRHEVESRTVKCSTLPVDHVAFTRDVANNVWHFRGPYSALKIRRRLSALLAWSDECVVTISSNGTRRYPVKQMNLDQDLVGVPKKILYEWTNIQLRLF